MFCMSIAYYHCDFNPLPNDNFLGWTKFKAFADDNTTLNAGKIKISVFERVENIVGKG